MVCEMRLSEKNFLMLIEQRQQEIADKATSRSPTIILATTYGLCKTPFLTGFTQLLSNHFGMARFDLLV